MTTTTKKANDRGPAFATVENFLDVVRGNQTKSAEASHTEAGGAEGPTTHPVKGVPDNTRPATEGARSKENTTDVKKDQGKPSVDATPEAKPSKKASEANNGGTASSDQIQIGTKKAPTGEDPAVETESVKPGKEDTGGYQGPTSHPARTDNDALNGGKYAVDLATDPIEKLASVIQDLGNDICADMAMSAADAAPTGAGATTTKQGEDSGAPQQSVAIDPNLAQQVGWEMAGILTGTLDKQATDQVVRNGLAEIIKTAEADADRTADWLTAFFNEQQKQASQQPPQRQQKRGGAMDHGSNAGGGGADLASSLGGGGGGGGPTPPPPGDDQAGPAAAGGGGDDGMAQLKELLDTIGVSPQELIEAISQEQGAGGGGAGGGAAGGGMPPAGPAGPAGGGGMPPGPGGPGGPGGGAEAALLAGAGPGGGAAGPQPGAPGLEVAASDKGHVVAPSKEAMASFIMEVVGRSRAIKAAAAAGKR